MTAEEKMERQKCRDAGCVDALDGSCAFDCVIDPRICTGLSQTPRAHKPEQSMNKQKMPSITIKGIDGKDLIIVNVKKPLLDNEGGEEQVFILTGKRKKPDILHWSAHEPLPNNDYSIMCQGLYHGNYGDAKIRASDLFTALRLCGANWAAASLKRNWDHWIND